MKIYYGVHKNWTKVDKSKCKKENVFFIPKGDPPRTALFGFDPIFGVVKNVKIVFDKTNCVIVSNEEEVTFDESAIISKHKPESIQEKLQKIHSTLQVKGGKITDEYQEQIMVLMFLKPDNKVLEIGGNIGRNSLVIAKILNNPKNLLVLECDEENAALLKQNQDDNKLNFYIEDSALSKRSLYQKGWDTVPSEVDIAGWKKVKTITYDQLMSKYNINFDTLVVDAEGALYWILLDEPKLLNGIKTVIMENDYPSLDQYEFVKNILLKENFNIVYSIPLYSHIEMCCKPFFYQVFQRK